MNKLKLSLVLILFVCSSYCSNYFENRKFNRVAEDFLATYSQFFPVKSTRMGIHKYDNQLRQFNQNNIENIIGFFKETTEKISKIDSAKLSNDNKANFQILNYQIGLHLFELEKLKRWQNDAYFYLQHIYDAVNGLAIYNIDTTENRTQHLIARLHQIPNLIVEAKKNFYSSEIINLTPAIERIDNLNRIIAFQLPSQFLVTDTMFELLNQKSEMVVDSLESFKIFLDKKLNGASNRSLILIPEMYRDYIRLLCDKKLKLDDIIDLIEADYQKYYNEILNISNKILDQQKQNYSYRRVNYSIEAVYDEIQNRSLNKDEIILFSIDKIIDIKRFIDEIMNLAIPEDFDVQVTWSDDNYLPIFKLAELVKPGLLGRINRYYCHLKPILNERDWYQQLSQLRDYNEPSLQAMMLLEAIPIHYQTWVRNRNNIPVLARAFPDEIFINGWQYYFAFSLLNIGFKGYDPELKYMLLREYLRNLLLAKVEIQYYLQQLSRAEQERILLDSKLFRKNELVSVFNQINISPGKALMVFLGLRQLEQLERSWRIQLGPNFNFNEFIHHILEPGPVPFELIKRNMVKN